MRADYPIAPDVLVMTDGAAGGRVEAAQGTHRFAATPPQAPVAGSYGAGDTFAGALTWCVSRGLPIIEACERAGEHATAVLTGINPLEGQRALR
jgi:ribokinase